MHETSPKAALDPTIAPRARFVAAYGPWAFGCVPLFFTVLGAAATAETSIVLGVLVATFGLIATIWAVDRARSLRGRPNIDVRVYPDAIAYTVQGGPWELVRFDEVARASLVSNREHHELRLERREGDAARLPLTYLSAADRSALAAKLRELAPGLFEGG